MKRQFMVVCIFMQIFTSLSVAGEIPAKGSQGRYFKTLEGMPLPVTAPVVGTLKGFIQTSEGTPLAGGEVFFFNEATGPSPAPEKYWRVADEMSSLDDKGGFSVELSPGRYFIGAILRKGGKTISGPPSDGDIYFAGESRYEVLPAAQNNLEVIKGAKPFSKSILVKESRLTIIEGALFDPSGKPIENVMVFAHKQLSMNDKPLFVSEGTNKEGAYQLRVAGGGTYYLRLRDIYGGGAPVEGTFMGAYGGNNPIAVVIKEGEVMKGINLTGERFMRPKPASK